MIDVSIIIVNYNTCKVTQDCINSIFEYTKDISFEIILVDNKSHDESFSVFTKDNRITYLYQDNNWGFGKANNIGFKYSKGKYLFLLNSDTLLKSNAIKEFYDFFEKAPKDIACIGTKMIDENGNYTTSYNNFPSIWTGFDWFSIIGPTLRKLNIIKNRNPKNYDNYVDFISGADIFMKRSIAERFGLFDPDFFMYFEETEMQYRYRQNNYKSYIYDVPKIVHFEGGSINRNVNSKSLYRRKIMLQSYFLYLKKTQTLFSYYFFRITYGIINPLWIIYPKYTFLNKISYIKEGYK